MQLSLNPVSASPRGPLFIRSACPVASTGSPKTGGNTNISGHYPGHLMLGAHVLDLMHLMDLGQSDSIVQLIVRRVRIQEQYPHSNTTAVTTCSNRHDGQDASPLAEQLIHAVSDSIKMMQFYFHFFPLKKDSQIVILIRFGQ
jgi:hypothetical protein